MRDTSSAARKVATANSEDLASPNAGIPSPGEARDQSPFLPNFDFETPDEETVKFLEEQWVRFCGAIGLTGDIPDIRGAFEPMPPTPPRPRRRWFARPFYALKDWCDRPFDQEER